MKNEGYFHSFVGVRSSWCLLVKRWGVSTTFLRNGKKVAMIDFVTGKVPSILLVEVFVDD
jgi:hypothetical protein